MPAISPLHDTLKAGGIHTPLGLMLSLKPGRYQAARDPSLRPRPFQHHLDHLNRILLKSLFRVPGHNRIILQLPPRHSKTTLTSYFIAAWMGTYPRDDVLTYSYSSRLATKQSAYIHDLFLHHHDALGHSLSPSTRSKAHFSTTGGGSLFAASMGGSAGGLGASGLLVIDDYSKSVTQAAYPSEREKNWHFWVSTLRQRIQDDTCVLVVASRTHRDDLTGRLLDPEHNPEHHAWVNVKLPLLAGADDPLGRPPGVTLCPEIYSQALAESQRLSTPPSLFTTVYQSDPPESDELAEWGPEHLGGHLWCDSLPTDGIILKIQSVDPSVGESKSADSDPSAITNLIVTSTFDVYAYCDVERRPIEKLARDLVEGYRIFAPRTIAVEANSFQRWLLPYVELYLKSRGLPSIPFVGINHGPNLGSKANRIRFDLSSLLAHRKLHLLRNHPGNKILFEQLKEFPNSRHDDAIDSLSLGVRVANQIIWGQPVT